MVSVIMPVFNREDTIARAIESVINQTYDKWELIVVDDGCTDKTEEIVSAYVEKESRIILIKNHNKKGVAEARNTGIHVAKGEYVAFLDSDDEWLEHHLAECINTLETTGMKMCSALWIENRYGKCEKIGEHGWYNYIFDKMYVDLGIQREEKLWIFDERLFEYIVMTDFYCFHINTLVVCKELLLKIDGFDSRMKQSEDLDLIYRLLQHTSLVTINSYHFIYYYGTNNLYAFIDRDSLDINELIKNKDLVKKFCDYTHNKIKLRKKMKKIVKERKNKKLIERINYDIYMRMITYVYICKYYYKTKGFIMLLKSIKYYVKYRDPQDSFFNPFSEYRKGHLYLD